MTYGAPYLGSKNRIAKDIIEVLPSGHRFVDLFAGGCAMTHAALASGKYDCSLTNDKFPVCGVDLFKMAVNGEFDDKKYLKLSCYDEFYERRYIDPWMISMFGWNGSTIYFAGKNSQAGKMISNNNITDIITLAQFGCKSPIQRLNRLRKLKGCVDLTKVEFYQMDYTNYQFREGDVVYCDPPYRNTSNYRHTKEKFDNDQFWQWVRTRDYPVYVSEYSAPDDFISIFEKKRGGIQSGCWKAKNTTHIEHLFIHRKFA